MRNSKALFRYLVSRITLPDDADEVHTMAHIVLQHLFSLSRTDILAEKEIPFTALDEQKLDTLATRISAGEPLQYVLGETEFYGRIFKITPDVLIPRPETEELVRLIINHTSTRGSSTALKLLDIGTGSGCIPITLALEIPRSEVYALDVSAPALAVAKENAAALHAHVSFVLTDVLVEKLPVQNLDAVVSNPPYIPLSESPSMKNNVLEFEPHLALFVPDNDPLKFYKAIAEKAAVALKPSGMLAVEINERFGSDVAHVFRKHGFVNVEVVKDIFGKERIVKGILG
ncbi:peptide chain release factor N(5)-glutamine methyltransferase [Chryseolinea lacunae]|uniref:Release factor glutamine methyltransferase n=1 Tax=Chryseolinea lacunae TaxID=2801331 RepID=A0ABS1KS56_9BACT|nr:peptide chain release factor N(5)-glutamine methyltransferase [Chryseolinea lacunae]MBL0742256.1 peptide chain release factor N(5)-glutamine methyltransferase [Chryseolinea lacunae]